MSVELFQPIGGIGSNATVILFTVIEGIPYMAYLQSGRIVFKSALTNSLASPLEFVLQRGTEPLVILQRGSQYLTGSSGTLTLVSTSSSLSLSSIYEAPPKPNILLSSAPYSVFTPERETVLINVEDSNRITRQVSSPLYFVFKNYTETIPGSESMRSCSRPNTSSQKAAEVFVCSQSRNSPPSFCSTIPSQTWTTHQDCNNNYFFTYCEAGTYCGGNSQKNCYAQCRDGRDCTLSRNTQILVCSGENLTTTQQEDVTRGIAADYTTKKFETSWWLVAAIIVFILLFIYLIYLFVEGSGNNVQGTRVKTHTRTYSYT